MSTEKSHRSSVGSGRQIKKITGSKRQFSSQMSQLDDSSDEEFVIAIAAAAYAIRTVEDCSWNQKRTIKGSESSLMAARGKRDDTTIMPANSNSSFERFSFYEANEDGKLAVLEDKFTKKTRESEQFLEDLTANQKKTENSMDAIPTTRKTATFTDKNLNDTNNKRFESGKGPIIGLESMFAIESASSLPGKSSRDVNPVVYRQVKEADAWEREEIARIKNRYEKRSTTILEWENEKKIKAKHQMEQQERGLQQRRAKAIQEYCDEIAWIEKMADGARKLADEKKRNDESKAREKMQLIRSRKTPRTCFCF